MGHATARGRAARRGSGAPSPSRKGVWSRRTVTIAGRAIGGGARPDQRRSRVAQGRPRSSRGRVRRGRRTGASRTPPRGSHTAGTEGLLVHEHGPLAVRAIPFSHRGRLVVFRSASGWRSGGSGPLLHRHEPAYLESGRARIRGRARTRDDPPGWGGSSSDPRRGAPYAASISLRLRRLPRAT